MKRTLLLAFSLLAVSALYAQSFEVSGVSDSYKGYIGDLIKAPLQLKNTSNRPITLVIRRIDAQLGTTQKSFICPNGLCPDYEQEEFTVRLEPGQSVQNLSIGLDAGLVPLSSHIKYLVYNRSNPADMVEFELNFAVEERPARNDIYTSRYITIHDVYPNPVTDFAHIDYKLLNDNAKAKIIIHNILGSALAEYELPHFETRVKIRADDLTSGIYFYTLYIDNEGVMTRKLIVKR